MDVVITVSKEGKKLEQFKADYPNIRTLKGFLNGQWNLATFDNCFKGRNRLGDVDASIEIGGRTLLIEFKSAKNGMNRGQLLKAIRQAKYSGITTMFVFGKRDNPEGMLSITPAENEKGFISSGYLDVDLDSLLGHIKAWSDWSEENTLVESKTAEWNEVSEMLSGLYAKG